MICARFINPLTFETSFWKNWIDVYPRQNKQKKRNYITYITTHTTIHIYQHLNIFAFVFSWKTSYILWSAGRYYIGCGKTSIWVVYTCERYVFIYSLGTKIISICASIVLTSILELRNFKYNGINRNIFFRILLQNLSNPALIRCVKSKELSSCCLE